MLLLLNKLGMVLFYDALTPFLGVPPRELRAGVCTRTFMAPLLFMATVWTNRQAVACTCVCVRGRMDNPWHACVCMCLWMN